MIRRALSVVGAYQKMSNYYRQNSLYRKRNIPGLLLLVNFEKAFDSVHWSIMKKRTGQRGKYDIIHDAYTHCGIMHTCVPGLSVGTVGNSGLCFVSFPGREMCFERY